MNKPYKVFVFVISIMFGFLIGMQLAFGYNTAKAMDYDVVQAVELLAVPMDMYQPEPESELEMTEIPEPITTYLGTYTVTAYCACKACVGKWYSPDNPLTASGTTPAEGITVGADWSELAKGTSLYIEGVGERIVEDRVAGWISKKYEGKVVDLFFYDHQDALDFGKKELEVWEVR